MKLLRLILLLRPPPSTQLPNFFKNGFPVDEFTTIRLLDAALDLGPQFFERGVSRALTLFKQAESFADHFACRLIPAGSYPGFDKVLQFRCERNIHAAADGHTS
jgi:hypothetical protein